MLKFLLLLLLLLLLFFGGKNKHDRKESDIKNSINKDRPITAILNDVLWKRRATTKDKLQI